MLQILQPSAHHDSSGCFLTRLACLGSQHRGNGFEVCHPHRPATSLCHHVGHACTKVDRGKRCSLSRLGEILPLLRSLSDVCKEATALWVPKISDKRCGLSLPSSPARGMAEGQQGRCGAVPVSLPPTPAYKARAHKVPLKAGILHRIIYFLVWFVTFTDYRDSSSVSMQWPHDTPWSSGLSSD